MGCGEALVKYILFFANFFFLVAGLALLGIGIAVQLQITAIVDAVGGNYEGASITTMVVGAIVFLIAFFGCCGAVRESNCMLITYAILVLIMLVCKVALASVIFVNLDAIVADVPTWLNDLFQKDRNGFHNIEQTFTCCGPNGAQSYGILNATINLDLPETCCATAPCTLLNSYPGCNGVVQSFFNTFGLTIGIVAIAVAAIELVAVVFALCLANHSRNKERRSRY